MSSSRRNFLKLAANGLALPSAAHARAQALQVTDRASDLRPRASDEAVIACAGDWFLTRRLSNAVGPDTETVFMCSAKPTQPSSIWKMGRPRWAQLTWRIRPGPRSSW